jgi:hypothetical protein
MSQKLFVKLLFANPPPDGGIIRFINLQPFTSLMKIKTKGAIIGAIVGLIIGILLLPTIGLNMGGAFLAAIALPIYTIVKYPFYLDFLNLFGMGGLILMIPYTTIVGAIYGLIIGWIVEKIKSKK